MKRMLGWRFIYTTQRIFQFGDKLDSILLKNRDYEIGWLYAYTCESYFRNLTKCI